MWLMLLFLAVIAAFSEKETYDWVREDGGYIENLRFVIGNSSPEQRICCFTDETENINYLFLPSYADTGHVKILFAGAEGVIFSGEEKEVAFKSGESIGALTCDGSYRMSFCDSAGRELAGEKIVIMRSANLPAAFLQTDSGLRGHIGSHFRARELHMGLSEEILRDQTEKQGGSVRHGKRRKMDSFE